MPKQLNSRCKELVASLLKYFEEELKNNGPLIPLSSVRQAVGAHDYNLDLTRYGKFLESVKFPVVCSNVIVERMPVFSKVNKSTIIVFGGDIKIGIIGYTAEEKSNLYTVVFSDELFAINEETMRLRQLNVRIMIAVGSGGLTMDLDIAKNVRLIDAVIGGKSESFMYTGKTPDGREPDGPYPIIVTQDSGKRVPIVQADAMTRYLGVLNLTFNRDGVTQKISGKPLYMGNDVPQDQEMARLVDKFRPEVEALSNKIVGESKVYLDATRKVCRRSECNFGNLVADAFVAYVAQKVESPYWTDYPIAFFTSGSLRYSINSTRTNGNITTGDLIAALPLEHRVVSCTIKGEYILKTLEICLKDVNDTSGYEFMQLSGMKVVYNMKNPRMHRVKSVLLRCGRCPVPKYKPLELHRMYNIVSTDELTSGSFFQTYLRQMSKNEVTYEQEYDVLEWYISTHSPVNPEVDNRIVLVSLGSKACWAVSKIFVICTALVLLVPNCFSVNI